MDESSSQSSPVVAELDRLVGYLAGVRARAAATFAAETFFFAHVADLVSRRDAERAARAGAGAVVDATQLGMREVYAEIAAALHLSELQVARRVSDATVLVSRFAETLYRVSDGVLSPQHAQVIADTGTVIDDPDLRAEYERHALTIADELTPAQLKDALTALVSRLDPDGTRERIRDAVTRRKVTVRPLEPGLSRVTADVPTVHGVGIVNRLRDMATELAAQNQADADTAAVHEDAGDAGPAEAAPAVGSDADADESDAVVDERTQGQVMADIFCDLLLTAAPAGHGTTDQHQAALAAIRPTVHVTIPAGTLTTTAASSLAGGTFTGTAECAGSAIGVAEVPGYGPVDDTTARHLAATADVWIRVFTHPTSGVPVTVDRYRPTTRQRLHLEARDQHCRFPGCRRPATHCDLDHTTPAATGGPTSLQNLACLCPRHHTLKHHTDWHVRQHPGGILTWTSPTRRVHTTRPPGTIHFHPEHPPGTEREPAPEPEPAPF
ncbi:MAG TPA: DUF222 domain-containing protein [Microbacterium sp.]|uniref:HNH endonuclease signature motif containing protein n=1 Tax=Microbacterium sp. TaxID=51671 RepID=UPI002B47520F|nr:DUF222 domain-containing protein [Microbacterium sp.]HKT55918.1 DUF222 domain-containing protein [Microbacterium sp.]